MKQLFKTKSLVVRELEKEDLPELLEIYNREENMRYVSSGKCDWSIDELEEKLMRHVVNYSRGYGIYVVEMLDGAVIGEASLFNSFDSEEVLELGYILDSDYWGTGLGFELLNGLLKYGFQILHLDKIVARMYEANVASARICEKSGMKLTQRALNDKGAPYVRYEIKKEDGYLCNVKDQEKTIGQSRNV